MSAAARRATTDPATPGRPLALVRPRDGRLIAGVAAGVAAHLGIDVVLARLAFVVLTAFGTFGVLAYAALWVAVVPSHDGAAPTVGRWLRRLARRQTVLLVVASVVVVGVGYRALHWPLPWPVLAAGYGAAVTWRQADLRRRDFAEPRAWSRLRSLVGSSLVVAAAVGVLSDATNLSQLRAGVVAVLVVLVAVALVTGPWWIRTVQALSSERGERIRSQERAELAARVHDSVLQTLTLIQRNADDPKAVQRYARRQERNLRELLYRPAAPSGQFSAAIEKQAAEVEDLYGVTIEVVVVGDCPLDARTTAVVDAAREAMVNAAKSGGVDEFAVFAEVEPAEVTVFVRDRGKGFELDAVPPNRAGIRESIVGRMERVGGRATVRTALGAGTEVKLSLGRAR
jgi:signal transduction histidine kinase/phage shock protein PspC (stress-responsive transcriptional regulator)